MSSYNYLNNNIEQGLVGSKSNKFSLNSLQYLEDRIINNRIPGSIQRYNQNGEFCSVGNNLVMNSVDQTSIGAERLITTLTSISPRIIETLYYELNSNPSTGEKYALSDFVPEDNVIAGSVWDTQIGIWKTGYNMPEIENSIVNTGKGQIPSASFELSMEYTKIATWAMEIDYNYIDLNVTNAATNGYVDFIKEHEKARKKARDLGMQKVRFLGLQNNVEFTGLLNQASVPATATLTKRFTDLNDEEFKAIMPKLFNDYITQNYGIVRANRMLIGMDDQIALTSQFAYVGTPSYSRTRWELLQQAFKDFAQDPGAQIIPVAYCQNIYNNIGSNRYLMYRYDEDCLFTKIPMPYQILSGMQSLTGMNFSNVAIERFSSVYVARPNTMLYINF